MKSKFKKRKKGLKFKTSIIVGIVSFFLLLPNVTQAFVYQFLQIFKKGAEMSAASIARGALAIFTQFVFDLFNWLVRAGGAFFNGMLNIGFESHLDIVKAGWQVTRDFSNMFFILFLVIIAFATILRFEKYGIKQLLPKIILIALLINFSLVICSAIIDFSNITANFFIKDVKQYAGKGGVSGNFVDSLNLLKTHTVMECDELSDEPVPPVNEGDEPGPSLQEQCIEAKTTPAAAQVGSDVITFAISMTVGSLVMLIAAFVLFAGGMLLLIRIVIVWFLVMLVPLVFICYIMPALSQNWKKWWKTFLQWCFFAPAYAFFIWLAMKVSLEARTQELAKMASGEFADVGPLTNIFLSTPANALIHYFFVIALLLGGLIAASKFGIYGADTAMKVGRGIYKGTARWTGARIRERAAKPAAGLAGGLAKTFGRVPVLRKLAQVPIKTMAAQRRAIDEEKKKLSVHSPATLKSLWPSFAGNRTQQIAAAQFLAEKGQLAPKYKLDEKGKPTEEVGNFRSKDIEKITKVAKIYGAESAMLINRPDLAPTVKKPTQTNEQAVEEQIKKIKVTDAEKIQFESFLDPNTVAAMFKQFTGPHFEKIAQSNIKAADILQGAIQALAPGNEDKQEERLRDINPRLAIYIRNSAASGTGTYKFG